MKKILSILTTVILLQFNFISFADNVTDDVVKAVDEFIATHPDISAVYKFKKNEQVVSKGSYGYFSKQDQTKLSPDQVMPIASGTKNIIAAAILKLEEKGKLCTSDTVAKFFPQKSDVWKVKKENGNKFPEWASQVTIHHLLTHSAGLPEYVFTLKIDTSVDHSEVNKQILHHASSKEPAFVPGTKSEYCNTGYVILGMIIEHVTKENLGDHLHKTFFKPLKMKNTHLASLQEAIDYKAGKLKTFPEPYFAHYKNDSFSIERAEVQVVQIPYAD